jgi:hypothetical protein
MNHYFLSSHASLRSTQRNLSDDDITFIMQHGSRTHRTGVIFCQLRHKDMPPDLPGNHRSRRLVGTTLVLCKCGQFVITAYRDERAFQRDMRKRKYYNGSAEYGTCPCYAPAKSAQIRAIA